MAAGSIDGTGQTVGDSARDAERRRLMAIPEPRVCRGDPGREGGVDIASRAARSAGSSIRRGEGGDRLLETAEARAQPGAGRAFLVR